MVQNGALGTLYKSELEVCEMRKGACRVVDNDDRPCSTAVKMALIIKALLIDAELDVNIVVHPKPWVFGGVSSHVLPCMQRKHLDTTIGPLLAHSDSKGVKCIEGLGRNTTALKVDCHEFLDL